MADLRAILLIFLLVVALAVPGCTLLKKKCDSSACIKAAFRNNCEEAYYEGTALGYTVKSDVSRDGGRCRVAEGVYSGGTKIGETICYYEMPVGNNAVPSCTRS